MKSQSSFPWPSQSSYLLASLCEFNCLVLKHDNIVLTKHNIKSLKKKESIIKVKLLG